MYSLIGDLEEIIMLFEIYIDSNTVYSELADSDYFEAGLYTGKGLVNAYFTGYAIF